MKDRFYKYRKIRPQVQDINRGPSLHRINEGEILTGYIGDMPASDLEERTARALNRLEIPFEFRVRVTPMLNGRRSLTREFKNLKGEVEIDHLVKFGNTSYPLFIDGQIAHHMAPWQQDRDGEKTDVVNEFGKDFGWHEAIRIPFWKLETQEQADRTITEIFFSGLSEQVVPEVVVKSRNNTIVVQSIPQGQAAKKDKPKAKKKKVESTAPIVYLEPVSTTKGGQAAKIKRMEET